MSENRLYRIRPLEKKNIVFEIETFERDAAGDYLRGFRAEFLYRWGQGFREMDNEVWEFEVKNGVNCDPGCGWGCELDDLISVNIEFDGDFTEQEQQEIEELCQGEREDSEGRWGEAWIFDGEHSWEIEMDQIMIYGPVQIDIVDADSNTVIESNIAPYVKEDSNTWPFPTQT